MLFHKSDGTGSIYIVRSFATICQIVTVSDIGHWLLINCFSATAGELIFCFLFRVTISFLVTLAAICNAIKRHLLVTFVSVQMS